MTDTLTVRPAGPGDAADICALLNAVDVIEIGRPETDLGSVEADLHHPLVHLATDSWLALQGGLPSPTRWSGPTPGPAGSTATTTSCPATPGRPCGCWS